MGVARSWRDSFALIVLILNGEEFQATESDKGVQNQWPELADVRHFSRLRGFVTVVGNRKAGEIQYKSFKKEGNHSLG